MEQKHNSVWRSVDWLTISLFAILIVAGWFSIFGASYDYGETDFLSFDSRTGKQLVWIVCSFGLGFVLLMLEDKLYDMFAMPLYSIMILLLIATIFVADNVKGSNSWITLGPIRIQPAEFSKFATALALAKYMGSYQFSIHKPKCTFVIAMLILLPIGIIIGQKETGSALVYLSFLLMFYREGMPGSILFSGACAIIYFVVGIRFADNYLTDGLTSIGPFAVQILILLFTTGMILTYLHRYDLIRNILLIAGSILLVSWGIDQFFPFNLNHVLLGILFLTLGYLIFNWLTEHNSKYLLIGLFLVSSVAMLYSINYIFSNVMEKHQQDRVQELLGIKNDPNGTGYNVKQSMIAIGSGGLVGKGFLNGTQTKLKYVPEQDTDFIFCTVGEEEGFIGSAAVLLLFTSLIIRLIYLSERQSSAFGRVYGYSVASIFIFHLFINIGMVLGLTPVIGIPLPFFSYGGSSLWGFTILLFIFLRIDAGRVNR